MSIIVNQPVQRPNMTDIEIDYSFKPDCIEQMALLPFVFKTTSCCRLPALFYICTSLCVSSEGCLVTLSSFILFLP